MAARAAESANSLPECGVSRAKNALARRRMCALPRGGVRAARRRSAAPAEHQRERDQCGWSGLRRRRRAPEAKSKIERGALRRIHSIEAGRRLREREEAVAARKQEAAAPQRQTARFDELTKDRVDPVATGQRGVYVRIGPCGARTCR